MVKIIWNFNDFVVIFYVVILVKGMFSYGKMEFKDM